MIERVTAKARPASAMATLAAALLMSTSVAAAPPIRINERNKMPVCVSPDRLMAFLRDRNEDLDPRYRDIARLYKHYGEAWGVRWDYAFYQMLLETNYLKFRRGNGRRGDVHEKQNNFAGIGATGGGVPGERFPDIKSGVHAQIQHLVAYSGERVAEPVARRTRENQDDIIAKSRRLGRPVTFGDLARRWAADRRYAQSIDIVASLFQDGYCHGPAPAQDAAASPAKPVRTVRFDAPEHLGGPKPQKLAGPETLPWQDEPTGAITQDTTPNKAAQGDAAGTAAPNNGARPPVRTLWSRDGDDGGQPDAPAQKGKLPGAPSQPSSDFASTAGQDAAHVAAPSGGASMAGMGEDAAELPTFRIAPALPEPARLGGPPPDTLVERGPGVAPPAASAAPDTAAPQITRALATPAPNPAAEDCRVLSASYGGKTTLLVRSQRSGKLQLTALTVLDGFEQSMLAAYAKANAPDAELLGTYPSAAEALARAKTLCAEG